MDLSFSAEQRLLCDSVDRFVERDCDRGAHRRVAASPERSDAATWAKLAGLGWLGLSLPPEHGGSGGDAVDVGIVAEGLGRGLVLEPYVSTVVLCGGLVARLGAPSQQALWLPRIAAGEARLAFAHAEPAVRHESAPLATRATRGPTGWRLDGEKCWVADGPGAHRLLVSAVTDGPGDAHGRVATLIVAPDAPGVTLTRHETVDGRLAANVRLDGVLVADGDCLGGTGGERSVLEGILDRAVAAACSDAVGCIRALLERTVAYSKTRVQFGQPIASNQALRHRMVDMAVQAEEARALALRAALLLDAHSPERARAASAAKIRVGRAARFVSEGAIQIHGAMGVTDELDVGAYVKRLLAFEMSLGTAADHQRRIVALRARAGGPRAFA